MWREVSGGRESITLPLNYFAHKELFLVLLLYYIYNSPLKTSA